MAISSANAAAAPKTRRVETLNSGTSWTVPAGVEYVNVTLVGGGGGGGAGNDSNATGQNGLPGQLIQTTITTTPGASITYAIGAGGTGGAAGSPGTAGNSGGNTTFTGATTASGGGGGAGGGNHNGNTGTPGLSGGNGGGGSGKYGTGGVGGNGQIVIEYFLQEMTMKKFAVIENNKVVNIVVGVEDEVVAANPGKYIEYTNGWDYNNGIDGGDFFPVPTPVEE